MLVDIHFSVLSTIFGNPRCGLKKAIGLTTTLHVDHAFFVHFLTVNARLRRVSALLWRAKTIRRLSFSFPELQSLDELNEKKSARVSLKQPEYTF